VKVQKRRDVWSRTHGSFRVYSAAFDDGFVGHVAVRLRDDASHLELDGGRVASDRNQVVSVDRPETVDEVRANERIVEVTDTTTADY